MANQVSHPGDARAKELTRYSQLFYAGTPEISNYDFDILYQNFKHDFPSHPYLSKVNPEFKPQKEVAHLSPVLSLETVVDSEFSGLQDFDRRVKSELGNPPKVEYILELKYDGLNLNLRYLDGHFKHLSTRGEGSSGEDVSHAIDLFPGIPKYIPGLVGELEIRGEGMMIDSEFLRINDLLESEERPRYANARNAVAGTVRTLDKGKVEDRTLVFFPYSFGGGNIPDFITSQSQALEWFAKHFSFPKRKWNSSKLHTSDLTYLYSVFQAVRNQRNDLGFAIDGIVYKVNSFELQKQLGFRSSTPRWAVAQKYPPETAKTTILDIDVQVGRTGKLTPVARLDPVHVGGVTVTNVTLHNVFDLRKRGVREGDEIIIQRAGDVIPEIAYRSQHIPRAKYLPNFKMPDMCPCCEGPTSRAKGEREYYCTNVSCVGRVVESLCHFVSRPCMNIKGLGEETIIHLTESAKVSRWLDLYQISEQDYNTYGKLAPSNAAKVMQELEKSLTNDFSKLIHALGIPNVGAGTSKIIASVVAPHQLPWAATDEKLINAKDIGETTLNSIARYFGEPKHAPDYLFFVHSYPGVNFKLPTEKGTKLLGKLILFTGSFETLKREELKALVENNGGKVSSTVSSKLSFVVAGSSPTQHKINKASGLGVSVITETDFLDLLN